jgi:hypothetical protein
MGKRAGTVKPALDFRRAPAHRSAMTQLRCALFLDFDNLVSGLRDGAGEEVALRFAEAPQDWLGWLAEGEARRFLLRRCYMNPAGAIEHEGGGRSYYSSFRWAFQAAGFEVVDCPRLTRMKNAADLRLPSTPWTLWPPPPAMTSSPCSPPMPTSCRCCCACAPPTGGRGWWRIRSWVPSCVPPPMR